MEAQRSGTTDAALPAELNASSGRAIIIISTATFLAMSVWFSASSVVGQLSDRWQLGAGQKSLLTVAVQLGFVVGALALAATGLADRVSGRRLFAVGAGLAAATNLLIIWVPTVGLLLACRVLTGMALAAVYPPALKEVSTWFLRGRGLAMGCMIAALTLGSALPHLINVGGGLHWRSVIIGTSVLAGVGSMLMLGLQARGPYPFARANFRFGTAFRSLRIRNVVLTNLGYIGHMWELYAMWAWIALFIGSLPAIKQLDDADSAASLLAFGCIGIGAVGCILGGYLADRHGRARIAAASLICSGVSAVTIALGHNLPAPFILLVCAFWGLTVIADSAQFSALLTQHAPVHMVGSALALQLALGYVTTMVSIWMVPVLVTHFSWGVALAMLAIGPVVGATSMLTLAHQSNHESAGS